MILIDKPYVSDFLKETLVKTQIQVVKTLEATELLSGSEVNFISEKEAIRLIREGRNTIPVHTNSENAIEWIEKNLDFSILPKQNELFKNKVKFRELIQTLYPSFFFKSIALAEIEELNVDNLPFPFIIKPAVGFFSFGVHKVEKKEDWIETLSQIKKDNEAQKGIYPEIVLNTTDFIIEECIEGDEFAVDCYFNEEGKVVVLNILHHLFSTGKDVNDRVYISSKDIIESNLANVEKFLQSVGELAELKNYPLHAEIRINAEKQITPIEINPIRFGGWCTTADLTAFAYNVNSYEYYQKAIKPNWSKIFEGKENKLYSLVVLDNNTGYEINDIKSFNYSKLKQNFNKILHTREVDFQKFLVFGFLFLETEKTNKIELENILHSNLREFIELK